MWRAGPGRGRIGIETLLGARRRRLSRLGWIAGCAVLLAHPWGAVRAAESDIQDPLSVTGSAPERADGSTPDAIEAPAIEATLPPGVGLEQLLRLPSSMSFEAQERSGESAAAWRERFREQQGVVAQARREIDRIKVALDEAAGSGAGSQWQIAPPGSNRTEATPVSFKLREELRASRVVLEGAEKSLRELEIEADLASVPPEWRR